MVQEMDKDKDRSNVNLKAVSDEVANAPMTSFMLPFAPIVGYCDIDSAILPVFSDDFTEEVLLSIISLFVNHVHRNDEKPLLDLLHLLRDKIKARGTKEAASGGP